MEDEAARVGAAQQDHPDGRTALRVGGAERHRGGVDALLLRVGDGGGELRERIGVGRRPAGGLERGDREGGAVRFDPAIASRVAGEPVRRVVALDHLRIAESGVGGQDRGGIGGGGHPGPRVSHQGEPGAGQRVVELLRGAFRGREAGQRGDHRVERAGLAIPFEHRARDAHVIQVLEFGEVDGFKATEKLLIGHEWIRSYQAGRGAPTADP